MSGWVKVMNALPGNPKILRLSDGAFRMYISSLCWSNEHLTDGHVPAVVLRAVALGVRGNLKRLAQELVEAGVWHVTDSGWEIHDYLEVQRSQLEIHTTKAWDAKRKSLFRDKELVAHIRSRDADRCRYCGIEVNWTDRRSRGGGTYDHVQPRGENTADNVVVACKGCNSRKGARTPEEAGMSLRPVLIRSSSDLDRDLDPGQVDVLESPWPDKRRAE